MLADSRALKHNWNFFFTFFKNLFFSIIEKANKEADEVEENEEPDLEQPGPSQEIRVEEPTAGSSQTNLEPKRLDNGRWKCPYCPVSTKRRSDINRHIKSQHSSNRWIHI